MASARPPAPAIFCASAATVLPASARSSSSSVFANRSRAAGMSEGVPMGRMARSALRRMRARLTTSPRPRRSSPRRSGGRRSPRAARRGSPRAVPGRRGPGWRRPRRAPSSRPASSVQHLLCAARRGSGLRDEGHLARPPVEASALIPAIRMVADWLRAASRIVGSTRSPGTRQGRRAASPATPRAGAATARTRARRPLAPRCRGP